MGIKDLVVKVSVRLKDNVEDWDYDWDSAFATFTIGDLIEFRMRHAANDEDDWLRDFNVERVAYIEDCPPG